MLLLLFWALHAEFHFQVTEIQRSTNRFVCPHHVSDLWVRGLHQHPSVGGDVVHELVERGPLDLLALQVRHGVQEVEEHAALLELLGEQFLLLRRRGIWD